MCGLLFGNNRWETSSVYVHIRSSQFAHLRQHGRSLRMRRPLSRPIYQPLDLFRCPLPAPWSCKPCPSPMGRM
jgi:hypothetical protein